MEIEKLNKIESILRSKQDISLHSSFQQVKDTNVYSLKLETNNIAGKTYISHMLKDIIPSEKIHLVNARGKYELSILD